MQPLSCDIYDYVEIACMRRYDVRLELISGDVVAGIACDTRVTSDKTECLVIESADGEHEVALHEVARMRVETPDATFTTVDFANGRH